jgi:hypothetical protein
MHRPSLCLAALLSVIACREPKSGAEAPVAPPRFAAEIPQRPSQDADAGPVLVDLLHSVACTVAVSSKVENPKDFPEHLVDGKAETAWNSKTGDLHGFIAFRTPKVARVRRVELTAGFDKVGAGGDLFTKNHRITRVRLTREGVLVKEADLDPEVRTLQGFDVDEAGGDFKLEVLATLPGSERKWQELTVSELRVLGFANGAPEKPEHIPAMAIGSLDGVPPHTVGKGEPPAGPYASVKELCAAYDKVMGPLVDAAFPGDRYPGKIEGPHCKPLADPKAASAAATVRGGPFLAAELVIVHDASEESARLVLRTEKGYSLSKVTLWSRYHNDPGCGHASEHSLEDAKLVTGAGGRPSLIVRVLLTDAYWLGATDPGGTVENAYACVVDSEGAAACEGPVVAGRAPGWPAGWDVAAGTFPAVRVSTLKWASRKQPVIGPAGDLRLAP